MTFIQDFKANVKNGPITRNDVYSCVAGFFLGGPFGGILSPVVYRGFKRRIAPWAMVGVVVGLPLSMVTMQAFILSIPTSSSSTASVSTSKAVTPAPAPAPAPKPEPLFNRDSWSKVKTGMTLTQVESIIGEGTLTDRISMGGTEAYNVEYSNMFSGKRARVTYANGVVFGVRSNF